MEGDAEDQLLERRLVNWGRWARDTNTKYGTSPMYRIIEEGMTKEEAEQRNAGHSATLIDEEDALIVNNAVLSTPFDTLRDRRDRGIFVAFYTNPQIPVCALLRKFRVSEREKNRSVKRIRHIVANYLQRLDDRDKIGGNN